LVTQKDKVESTSKGRENVDAFFSFPSKLSGLGKLRWNKFERECKIYLQMDVCLSIFWFFREEKGEV